MKKIIFLLMLVLLETGLSAQTFDLSAEVRPRFESRHGYKSLIAKDVDGANFVSQRTRLNFKYKQDKMRFGMTLQNVRVWGDVKTLSAADALNSFHEAWAEAILSDKISLKLGRQEIIYDDHRIFGSVGWAQQARSHDAFIARFTPNANHKLDVGLAMNADKQGLVDDLYSGVAGYKAFEYLHYHGKFDKVGLSVLVLNTGVEYENDKAEQKIANMQTIGPRVTYKSGKFSANAATYFQSGNKAADTKTIKVSALYAGGAIGYKINDNFSAGFGVDYLSGNTMDPADTNKDFKSFTPLFGTNHKFNGWMDYFYVGNHIGSVGLMDINLPLAFKKGKFNAKLIPHFFSSAGDVYKGTKKLDKGLGTEVDFTMGYKISKNISVKAGYSMMFATDAMEILKGGSKDESNNWGWVMFVFKPHLFTYTAPANAVEK